MAESNNSPKKTPKPRVSKGPTKKDMAQEVTALKLFDNMCFLITSTTPEFIQTNIQKLNRTTFSESGKAYIAQQAELVAERAKTNPKIILPAEWSQLIAFNDTKNT